MNELFKNLNTSIQHIKALNDFFSDENNYIPSEEIDFRIYNENSADLITSFSDIGLFEQLYNQNDRQMILADIIEYIFLGRGFYAIGTRRQNIAKKEKFAKGLLHFVNLLMCYESITVNVNRRNRFLDFLSIQLQNISAEQGFTELRNYSDAVGIPGSTANDKINRYFDKLLPKTAGGLWHELLVYIFVIRNDLGYILPLLLHQKIYSKDDHLVPPDFLIITKDKRIYGIEVGIKKEIQSGSFSLKTAVPTATIDTINSRNSDRCPICKKWINICPYAINKFSDFSQNISKVEIKCLRECNIYSRDQILTGQCPYCKYSRGMARTLPHTNHQFSDNKHYHYGCVLSSVAVEIREGIIAAEDNTAIKTHIPYYSGLEELFKNDTIETAG
jgi:hypothetical protein